MVPKHLLTASSVIAYSLCSGLLLLMNKVVLSFIPSTPLVVAFQCVFCIAAIVIWHAVTGVPKLSEMTPPVLKAYAQYGVLFVGGIYTNMRALESSNVDTVIVFRSASPLVVAIGDYVLLGRAAPSARSFFAMLLVFVGAAAFVATDAEYKMKGLWAYAWNFAYLFFISAEMLLGKQITSAHQASLGTSVLMTNAIGLFPFLAIGWGTGELNSGLVAGLYTPGAVSALLFSCALSAGIGFSSWWCRGLVSATSFTVIGTVNKIITVFLNILIWDKHASPLGTALLFLCLAGGALYQQAPLRGAAAAGKQEPTPPTPASTAAVSDAACNASELGAGGDGLELLQKGGGGEEAPVVNMDHHAGVTRSGSGSGGAAVSRAGPSPPAAPGAAASGALAYGVLPANRSRGES